MDVRRDLLLRTVTSDPLFVRWKRDRYYLGRVEVSIYTVAMFWITLLLSV